MPEKLSRDFIEAVSTSNTIPHTGIPPCPSVSAPKTMVVRNFCFSDRQIHYFPYVHHASQILNQAAVGIIRGRFIEKASSVRVGIQNYLHRINHSRFSAAGVPGEKVDFFAEGKSLPADIMPVIQADAGKVPQSAPCQSSSVVSSSSSSISGSKAGINLPLRRPCLQGLVLPE